MTVKIVNYISMESTIIKKIRSIRIEKGYSQEYVGIKIGESQNVIHKIESGKMKLTLQMFLKICNVLEISHQEIIADKLKDE